MEERKPKAPENREDRLAVGTQFFWEIIIFLTGLFMGFFWYMYFSESGSAETHIIIGLIVIIMCLARYIFLLWQRQK